MEYIVIGNKPYININCNKIFDSFQHNIRCNLHPALEKYNVGTKIDNYICNGHVFDYINDKLTNTNLRKVENLLKSYVDTYDENYVNDADVFFHSNIKKIQQILKQNMNDKNTMNQFFKNNNIQQQYTGEVIRIGYSAILYLIQKNINNIYVSGFGIQKKELLKQKNNKLINIYERQQNGCHNYDSEIEILIELHKRNIIDATMCTLIDNNLPTFDCSYFNLKHEIIKLFFNE